MPHLTPGKLLRLMLSSDDRHDGRPLHEVIVDHCRESGVSGTSVFAGHEGFGESGELVRPHGLSRTRPVVVTIIDSTENVARLLEQLRPLTASCLVTVSDVLTLRIQNTSIDS
jgi:hypothetical protein